MVITQSTCRQRFPPFNNQSFCFVFISVEWKITPVKRGVKYEVPILPGRIPRGNIQSSVPQSHNSALVTLSPNILPHISDARKRFTTCQIITKLPPLSRLLKNSPSALQVWSTYNVKITKWFSWMALDTHGVGVSAFKVKYYENKNDQRNSGGKLRQTETKRRQTES